MQRPHLPLLGEVRQISARRRVRAGRDPDTNLSQIDQASVDHHKPSLEVESVPIGSYAPSTHFCNDPSNGQSLLVYRAAIVEMPDQAPRTT